MNLTKEAIIHSQQIEGINDYMIVINSIESNIDIHPDIAIESCKSLIEGLCKKALVVLSEDYRSNKRLINECNQKLPTLTITTFNHIFQSTFESKLYYGLYKLIASEVRLKKLIDQSKKNIYDNINGTIQQINVIRSDKGDLCHGRIYPKDESSVYTAKSIASITDGICSFIIHVIADNYKLDEKDDSLDYEKLNEYNNWLDESIENFPIINERYSKILYIHDQDTYTNVYNDKFLARKEDDKERKKRPNPSKFEKTHPEFALVEFYMTPNQLSLINNFAVKENLDFEKVKYLFGNLLFFSREVLDNEVIDLLKEKPSLKEIALIRSELVNKINAQILELKNSL